MIYVTAELIDPVSGLPFPNNQIPIDRVSPAAQTLLKFIPVANLPGSANNFHNVTNYVTSSDTINLRVTQNFTPAAAGAGGRGVGARGGGEFRRERLAELHRDTLGLLNGVR